MPATEDFYEPPGTIGLAPLEKYWALRKESARSVEQAAVLLAMTQAQAAVLDLSISDPKLHTDPRLQTLQVMVTVCPNSLLLANQWAW